MMKKVNILLLILLLPLNIFSQLTPPADNYTVSPVIINPAYAGNTGTLSLSAFYRHQWIGIKGAPATMGITAESPVRNDKIGLGVILSNTRYGVSSETRFISNYSYKIHWGKGDLSFGLGAGIITTNTAWSDLLASDKGDEDVLVDSKTYAMPHVSFGALYSYQGFFTGLSAPSIFDYSFNSETNKYDYPFDFKKINYMWLTGSTFKVDHDMKIQPSVLLSYVTGKELLYDINAYAIFSDRFYAGASYRNKRSVAALFQFQINNRLKVAYSYNFDINKMGRYNYGSHEIMLRYDLHYRVDVVNPLQF